MPYLNLNADTPHLPSIIGLSDKAFRLYVSLACYSARWSADSLHINHARSFVGIRARRWLNELVEHELAEWVDEPTEFRVFGEGDIWRNGPVKIPRKSIPDRVRRFVYERDENACVFCGATETLTLDHIHPHSLGGSGSISNLQTLCQSCNSRKGARV